MAAAGALQVSPVSFYEIGQKVRLGKWPDMTPFVDNLPDLLLRQGGAAAPLDAELCLMAGTMEWTHRDPFDRLLAATAPIHGMPRVSADPIFDGRVARIW